MMEYTNAHSEKAPPKPADRILLVLFGLLLGLYGYWIGAIAAGIALYRFAQVNSYYNKKDYDEAFRQYRIGNIWMIISLVIGTILTTIKLILYVFMIPGKIWGFIQDIY